MSPLKVEKETAAFGKETFYIASGGKYVIEFVGNKRVTLHGNIIGGRVETTPDTKAPDQSCSVNLTPFSEPVALIGRRRQDKENSTYTITGEL